MVTPTASMQMADAPFLPDLAVAIPASGPAQAEIVQFLNHEALLLDRNRLDDWLGLLSDDLVYWMPVRLTQDRNETNGFSTSMGHFDDTYQSMANRVRRFTTAKAVWAENPPSRYRRLVANILAYRTDSEDEYLVSSYLLLIRNRGNIPTNDVVSAERHDIIRRTPSALRLARREIYVDQSTVGIQNLAAFL
jgi:3-phenylpropionate/cinnamic acid dioxygenase small subunit